MGLVFLAPIFLAALAGVAIPVLIHLTHRPRERVVAFPSLMFLRRIPYRSVRRQRIRHWWLFLLRVAAVVALAAAFARPLLDALGSAAAGGAARDVVVLIDRSLSMRYGDRWDRAREVAREVVNGLGPDDRAALVGFADRAAVIAGPTGDRGVLLGALEDLEPGWGATRLGPAVSLAGELLEESGGRREVVIVGDMQRPGPSDETEPRLPGGTQLTVRPVAEGDWANLAVHGVAVERLAERDRSRVNVTARVINAGAEDARGVPVTLEIDGATVARAVAEVPGHGAAAVRFDRLPEPAERARLVIRAGDDDLSADNAYYAVLAPSATIPVLLVSSGARTGLYVRRALEIGVDPRVAVTSRRPVELRASDVSGTRVVVLLDTPWPAGQAGSALQAFARGGGGVLFAAGRNGAGTIPSVGGARGLRMGEIVERLGRDGRLAAPDLDHPAFALFRLPHSGDLAAARFLRYRAVADPGDGTVVARFDDGQPALVEMRGGGRVLVWTSTLDDTWSDFPLQPVFLPFLHEAVRYLAAYQLPVLAREVGQLLDPRRDGDAESPMVVEDPAGVSVSIGPEDPSPGLTMQRPGFYVIRPVGGPGARQEADVVAANLVPEESDLATEDAEDLRRRLAPSDADGGGVEPAVVLAPVERERRQGLWWYLLIAMLAALLAESVLASRIPAAPGTAGS